MLHAQHHTRYKQQALLHNDLQCTIWGVSQLSAHNTGISVVPEVITDGTPSGIDTYLQSPIWPKVTATITDKAQCPTGTWSYGSALTIGGSQTFKYRCMHLLCSFVHIAVVFQFQRVLSKLGLRFTEHNSKTQIVHICTLV